jgi:FKBP12-rapamycin complex-associated protein
MMLTFLWWYQCSGKILHIDFGDCFEASMNREKFPEKVDLLLAFNIGQCTVLLVILTAS